VENKDDDDHDGDGVSSSGTKKAAANAGANKDDIDVRTFCSFPLNAFFSHSFASVPNCYDRAMAFPMARTMMLMVTAFPTKRILMSM
jgi:hypothetical protein